MTLDTHIIRNEDLLLKINQNINPTVLDLSPYEAFIDALCGRREYQKQAIRTVLEYLVGGNYSDLLELARENYQKSAVLQGRYRNLADFEVGLQLPTQLSCTLDLATATGKSYVMYGVARIMLALGSVDRVLLLCPSNTIEKGLKQKFVELSMDQTLKSLIPHGAMFVTPQIGDGSSTIVEGSICIENFHATLEHVGSSIRESLRGKGSRTLILNDEVHHVYNMPGAELKKWKQFLMGDEFGFRYVVGFSGTCYIANDYFSDVIFRYSLRQALEDGYTKTIDYVAEDRSYSSSERLQKMYDNHTRNKLLYRRVKSLSIVITKDIPGCKRASEDLISFIANQERITVTEAEKKVLVVTSSREHQANLIMLNQVDANENPIEWIVSVSMLTEGWDVKNVFQIVPHEERAFNSKLLISQVLGRGLRVPEQYRGEHPVVTVFNHDSWSSRIKQLVDEVLDVEKRLYSFPVRTDYDFTLHNIDYSKQQELTETVQSGEYEFTKGYVTLMSQAPELERETIYERIRTGERRSKKTMVTYAMFPVPEVAAHIYNKLCGIDLEEGTHYAKRYTMEWILELIRNSLRKVGEVQDLVSEENRQRLQRAFGVIHRKSNLSVRYKSNPEGIFSVSTSDRRKDSISFSSLRRGDASILLDNMSVDLSDDQTRIGLQELLEDESLPRSSFIHVANSFHFRTSLNIVLTNHRPERDFVRQLIRPENTVAIDAWVKSTDRDFYSIEYAWRKGEHAKRGTFNPDFFVKCGHHILVAEIKGDEEISEPSDENVAKYRAAATHFDRLNMLQSEQEYHFCFLTPRDYDKFFKFLREGKYSFVSELDVTLQLQ